MSMLVLLDNPTLGRVSNPRASPTNERCRQWLEDLLASGVEVRIPEIIDYEIRRVLVRNSKVQGIDRLNRLIERVGYIALCTPAMREAAQYWAEARRRGRAATDNKRLDADMILCGQAKLRGSRTRHRNRHGKYASLQSLLQGASLVSHSRAALTRGTFISIHRLLFHSGLFGQSPGKGLCKSAFHFPQSEGDDVNSPCTMATNRDRTTVPDDKRAKRPRSTWLLELSLFLAVFLEVLPTEAGILTGFVIRREWVYYGITKMVSLTVIVLPLVIYINRRLTKTSGQRRTIWTWKLIVILIILALNLFVNLATIARSCGLIS